MPCRTPNGKQNHLNKNRFRTTGINRLFSSHWYWQCMDSPVSDVIADRFCSGLGPATLISTVDGDLPVEWLAVGDRVVTRDGGAQPIRKIIRYQPEYSEIVADPTRWPITIPKDQFSTGCPNHPLVVSPLHRVLLTGGAIEYLFGQAEVFAAAAHLFPTDCSHAPRPGFTYYHLLLDDHHAILANGLWTESLLASEAAISGGSQIPDHPQCTARPCLHKWETMVLCDLIGLPLNAHRHAA